MYDFHAHILPCIDHGSRSLEDTARQLAILAENGVTHVVASPHFYPDEWSNVENFLAHRKKGEEALLSLLQGTGFAVYPAAEVLLSEGLEHMENLSDLCIAGTNILLAEMPFFHWNDRLIKTVERLHRSGLCILLAHVDRYPKRDVEKLFALGAVGQVNCEAFASIFRRGTYRSWIKEGFVCALGSDIHSPEKFRAKSIDRARAYLGDTLTARLDSLGAKMLDGACALSK